MADLVKACLDRLLVEANVAGAGSKAAKDLRESITTAMEELAIEKDDVVSAGGDASTDMMADKYWLPFRLACQPVNTPKVRETSLDGLQKMMAHKVLRGALPWSHFGPSGSQAPSAASASAAAAAKVAGTSQQNDLSNLDASSPPLTRTPTEAVIGSAFLIDDIIHTTCTTFTGASTDDAVQLQVLKVLLTAVTSTACEVHGVSLLKVIQTCFNIHLHSKSPTNQVTAKASLTQMVNLIFSRMERYSEVLQKSGELFSGSEQMRTPPVPPANTVPRSGDVEPDRERVVTEAVEAVEVIGVPDSETDGSATETLADGEPPSAERIAKEIMVAETLAAATADPPQPESIGDDVVVPTSSKTITREGEGEAAIEGAGDGEAAADGGVSEAVMLTSDRPPLPPNLVTPVSTGPVTTQLETLDASSAPNPYDPTIAYYNELLRRDVFLVFRLLCRLSTQTDNGPPSLTATFSVASVTAAAALPSDELSPLTVRARCLALELILSVLNNAGSVLLNDELFTDLIKTNISASVSRNGITTNPLLFELSLSIFLMLIRYYRSKLKTEVEVLLNTVYLHILEMGNSTYKQKSLVLQGLLKICENPQTLVDLYINYDCDLATVSLFERIVSVCARVAQGKESTVAPAPMTLMGYAASAAGLDLKGDLVRAQDKRLRLRGLVCLVAIINSLVDWSAELAPNVPIHGKPKAIEGNITVTEPLGVTEGAASTSTASDRGNSPAPISQELSVSTPARSIDGTRSTNVSMESAARSFLDALAPTHQSNPVVLNKHPLHSVSMVSSHINSSSSSLDPMGSGVLMGSPGLAGSTLAGTPTGDEDPSQIEEIASRKLLLKQGLRLFEQKPMKGVQFFINHGFIAEEPTAIAKFLATTPGLDKAAIGDYLGEADSFKIKVMHAFVDLMDFADVGFVTALRTFLQSFRLPGEAQKPANYRVQIDRIMEKFADRYCENNPTVFAKADTAYVLAFSVIMLNTDQHSSQIKNRMEKQEFISNNRGINDNADLPESFLVGIFEEIQSNEIIMEEEQAGKFAELAIGWGAGNLSERQRMELYHKEMAHVQKKSQMLMKSAGQGRSLIPFRPATQPELARPMFTAASWPLMAALSLLFESAVDDSESVEEASDGKTGEPKVYELCLQGFAGGIRIAALFRMETERDAFATSLYKLTGLAHFGEIRPKNVKAIKTLIALSNSLGEYLETSWLQALQAISQLERLQLIGNRNGVDPMQAIARKSLDGSRRSMDPTAANSSYSFFGVSSATTRPSINNARPDDHVLSLSAGGPTFRPSPALERLIAEFSTQTTVVAVDRIFSTTVTLSGAAICHFFRALCYVSLEEVGLDPSVLALGIHPGGNAASVTTPVGASPAGTVITAASLRLDNGPPRMYLLQKIVEIAYYNMLRIRYEWSQIWRILQPYFNTVGTHPNVAVSTFAVDALRQLNMKFLEKEELGHFSTQNELLKSFEWIMRHNTDSGIRELILNSLSQMIAARAGSIRSGWKSIFVVLSKAAQPKESDERLVEASFDIVQIIFKEHFTVVIHAGGFVDYVACLAEFALLKGSGAVHDDVVTGSIQVLQFCAKHLVQLAEEEAEEMKGRARRSHDGGPLPPQHFHPTPQNSSSTLIPGKSQPYLLPNGIISEDHFVLKWFPILSALSRVVIDSESLLVRTRALDSLFETLRAACLLFDVKYWKNIFRSVILPIFEDLKEFAEGRDADETSTNPGSKEGSTSIWIQGLRLLVDLFTDVFDIVSGGGGGLVQEALDLIILMLKRRDEKPVTLETLDFDHTIVKCVTHIELLQAVRDVALTELIPGPSRKGSTVSSLTLASALVPSVVSPQSPSVTSPISPISATQASATRIAITVIPLEFRTRWLRCIHESYAVARAFNSDYDLRHAIWRRGLVQQLPNLVKQETIALAAHIRLLFAVYRAMGDDQQAPLSRREEEVPAEVVVDNVADMLVKETEDVFERFVGFLHDQQQNARDIALWGPVVVMIFKELLHMDGWWGQGGVAGWGSRALSTGALTAQRYGKLRTQLPKFFRLGIKMLGVDRADVRMALQEFMERVVMHVRSGGGMFSRMTDPGPVPSSSPRPSLGDTSGSSVKFLPQKIGLRYKKPTLYIIYKDNSTGKSRRRKIPIRSLLVATPNSSDYNAPKAPSTRAIAVDLVERHPVLKQVKSGQIEFMINKIREHAGLPAEQPVSASKVDVVIKPALKPEATMASISPFSKPLAGLPPLPDKLVGSGFNATNVPPPKPIIRDTKAAEQKPIAKPPVVDGKLNLNKLTDDELEAVKNKMESEFVKKLIKPGDPGYKYDVQKSFDGEKENNEWDDESSMSASSARRMALKGSTFAGTSIRHNVGDLESDNEEIDEEISDFPEEDEGNEANEKSSSSANEDDEGSASGPAAFWWMKKDAEKEITETSRHASPAPDLISHVRTSLTSSDLPKSSPLAAELVEKPFVPPPKPTFPVQAATTTKSAADADSENGDAPDSPPTHRHRRVSVSSREQKTLFAESIEELTTPRRNPSTAHKDAESATPPGIGSMKPHLKQKVLEPGIGGLPAVVLQSDEFSDDGDGEDPSNSEEFEDDNYSVDSDDGGRGLTTYVSAPSLLGSGPVRSKVADAPKALETIASFSSSMASLKDSGSKPGGMQALVDKTQVAPKPTAGVLLKSESTTPSPQSAEKEKDALSGRTDPESPLQKDIQQARTHLRSRTTSQELLSDVAADKLGKPKPTSKDKQSESDDDIKEDFEMEFDDLDGDDDDFFDRPIPKTTATSNIVAAKPTETLAAASPPRLATASNISPSSSPTPKPAESTSPKPSMLGDLPPLSRSISSSLPPLTAFNIRSTPSLVSNKIPGMAKDADGDSIDFESSAASLALSDLGDEDGPTRPAITANYLKGKLTGGPSLESKDALNAGFGSAAGLGKLTQSAEDKPAPKVALVSEEKAPPATRSLFVDDAKASSKPSFLTDDSKAPIAKSSFLTNGIADELSDGEQSHISAQSSPKPSSRLDWLKKPVGDGVSAASSTHGGLAPGARSESSAREDEEYSDDFGAGETDNESGIFQLGGLTKPRSGGALFNDDDDIAEEDIQFSDDGLDLEVDGDDEDAF
ncbi:Brefeldin A-inhibited guanine nucleotide-exchange protein 2 [Irineochytrium annulatum]|nr:Brefeldin A-inhibited guanine nucleotide-exchange protein 2 [Irineochytrium annulatum]